jgi:hypothetical protein
MEVKYLTMRELRELKKGATVILPIGHDGSPVTMSVSWFKLNTLIRGQSSDTISRVHRDEKGKLIWDTTKATRLEAVIN